VLAPDAPIAAPARSVWQCRALVLGLGLLLAVDAATAQDQQASFDIPAQPLADALVAYGSATGIEVFYDGALAIGHRSTAVTGVHRSMVALQILLRGTGYVPMATDYAATVTITRASHETVASQTAALDRYEPYFAVLQARVSEVLCKSDEAKPGDEQIILSFWFDPSGMVSRVQVLGSELSRDRRLAIASGVRGLHIGSLPSWPCVDVIMDVSKIRTYLGGNLDITAPGGNLQVSALSSTATGPNNGVLTINGGEIRILTGMDTMINTSRILTARGGDITIWASYGDIDAGKGKKSALTNPPVTYALSDDGNISYTVNPSFSGSGISTQKGAPDAPISSVDLYAPDGIINAGDAGIRSSGAIYLGALEIRGAENIRADGEIKGVPKQAASVGSLNLETKDKMAADAAKDLSQPGAREQASVIIVEVIGYGGGDTGTPSPSEEERQRTRGQDQKQGSYDPNSIFRVVGSGELTAEQKQKLTSEERANLESR
jgi:hypothetical protein